MAQFRTTADITDEVLQKSGEVTNGNSPYESQVLTYLNRAHQVIVSGGSVFSRRVDEDWKWARSKNPIVLELKPPYLTGTVTVTRNDVNITFSSAPSESLNGWYLQLVGYKTIYRLTSHTTGVASAVIDSALLEASGAYDFRCFKLDYEIFPSYLYVDKLSDKVDFEETDGTTLTATLDHGSYTPGNLISHVVSKLNTIGASTYTGSYDETEKLFTITSDRAGGGGVFTLLGATGASPKRSALPLLGFDRKDYADEASQESTYIINGISRLVAPFKVFTANTRQPFIKGLDPEILEEDYPISLTEQRLPTHFSIIEERSDGTYVVRMNSYPSESQKAIIDWVPVPHDLQDNAASIPLIPRRDIDTLIHGAAAFVLFDKEDSKWEQMFGLCEQGLEAMEKKNRSEEYRTNNDFGQIIPRQDLLDSTRKFKYGYEFEGNNVSATSTETTQQMINVDMSYTQFQTAATTNTVTARTLPSNRSLFALIIKLNTQFTGGSISALTADVGITTDTDRFILGFDLQQAVSANSQDSMLTVYYPAAATNITVTLNATGDNLSALTQGSITVYFQETIVEA